MKYNDIPKILSICATKNPDKIAIISDDEKITYKELNSLVNKYANLFLKNGLKKGDRIAIALEKCPNAEASTLGGMRAGGKVILTGALNSQEASALIRNSNPEYLVTTNSFLNSFDKEFLVKTNIKMVVVIDNDYLKQQPSCRVQLERER